jgi:hypothetical protein
MQDDPADGGDHLSTELEQSVAQRRHLGTSAGGPCGTESQLLDEHVGSSGEEDAELVGEEAGAAGAINLESVVKLFDPVFDLSTIAIDVLVDEARCLSQVGDEESGIVLHLATRMADHLGLDDDPSHPAPGSGRVEAFSIEVLRAAGSTREPTGFGHELPCFSRQHCVLGHVDEVIDPPLVIEEVEDLRACEAAVQAHEDAGVGKSLTKAGQQAPEKTQYASLVRSIARSQDGGKEELLRLVVEGEEAEQGQVAPGVIVGIEETELLFSMGGIVRDVEINSDPTAVLTQSPALAIDDQIDQRLPHPIKISRADGILETGEGWLGGQWIAMDRVSIEEQLVDWIIDEPRRVVGVRIAACDPEDPLGEQISEVMRDLARLTLVGEAAGEPFGQPELIVGRFEEHRPAVGASVLEVETGKEGAIKKLWKLETLCRILLAHRKASCVGQSRVATALYHEEAFSSSGIMNNAG